MNNTRNLGWSIITAPLHSHKGILTALDSHCIPFPIQRVYLLSRIPAHASRGFHAHKTTHQVIFCLQGSVRIKLDNGSTQKTLRLSKSNKGIYIQSLVWHELHEFAPQTILLIVASTDFDESDYIRDYSVFQTFL